MSVNIAIQLETPSELNNKVDQSKKPAGLCTRFAYGVANRIKGFSLGVAAAGVITPLTSGTTYLGQKIGLIPEFTKENNIQGMVANFQKMGFSELNADRLINATCYFKELSQQLNLHVIRTPDGWERMNTTPEYLKGEAIGFFTGAALEEEILFRGLIQNVCLTRIPKFVIKKISPGKETILDTTMAKAARILITSAAFSAYHLRNKGIFSDSYVSMQLVATFMMGIGFGLLKESQAGLAGAIGAHNQ